LRILVTGSSGYIGSHLVRALAGEGHQVVGLDRRPPPQDARLAQFVQSELAAVRREALGPLDGVFHLAAARVDWGPSEEDYFRDNVDCTGALLDALGDSVPMWVFTSTVSVYGPSRFPLAEPSPRRPINPYGRSKAKAEELFEGFASRQPEASIGILRPSVVFGPGNPPDTNIFRLVDSIWKRRFIMVGNGETPKATSYITNVVAATMFLANLLQQRNAAGLVRFNYVDEPLLNTGELVQMIRARMGRTGMQPRVPLGFARPTSRVMDVLADLTRKDLPITSARINKFCTPTAFDAGAIRKAGFRQPVAIEDAIDRTLEDYLRGTVGAASGRPLGPVK
jgi:nucleoside-diphosphate-sugar epimerase